MAALAMQSLLGPDQSLFNIFSQHIFQTNLICGSKPRRTAAVEKGQLRLLQTSPPARRSRRPTAALSCADPRTVLCVWLGDSPSRPGSRCGCTSFLIYRWGRFWLRDLSKSPRTQEDKVAGPLRLVSSYLQHWSAFSHDNWSKWEESCS